MEFKLFDLSLKNCTWLLSTSFGYYSNQHCQLNYDGSLVTGFYQTEEEKAPLTIDDSTSVSFNCSFDVTKGINPGRQQLELDFYLDRAILDTGGFTSYTSINQTLLSVDTKRFHLEGKLNKGNYILEVCYDKEREEKIDYQPQSIKTLINRLLAIS